jgi:hypothetical protein
MEESQIGGKSDWKVRLEESLAWKVRLEESLDSLTGKVTMEESQNGGTVGLRESKAGDSQSGGKSDRKVRYCQTGKSDTVRQESQTGKSDTVRQESQTGDCQTEESEEVRQGQSG